MSHTDMRIFAYDFSIKHAAYNIIIVDCSSVFIILWQIFAKETCCTVQLLVDMLKQNTDNYYTLKNSQG